jgi:hypothetical protein
MSRRFSRALLSAMCWLAMASGATAGPFDVTFQMPLNLTHLATLVDHVHVTCKIDSTALPQGSVSAVGTDIKASGGQIVTTATVVVPVTTLDTSNGKTSATYSCFLTAFMTNDTRSYSFGNDPTASWYLSPTPGPLTGSFTW